ncbi:MAG: FAD-dependent oxidoreductase [Proteobacteria bacterium]|nr:FAD-dependent oxidoreductase [Pseudomonadota bacterium]
MTDLPRQDMVDVIVVGYGFAGGAAAIAAADAGCRVTVLEKMAVPGGISICSGGGMRVASDAAKALAYLEATNQGTIERPLLERFAREMTELRGHFEQLAQASGATLKIIARPANYALPGWDTFHFLEVDEVPGFDPRTEFPHARSLRAGINAFKVVADNVRARPAIDVRFGAAVTRLERDADGCVCGVVATIDGHATRIGARRGVILACGGFEANAAMQQQYWQLRPVLPAATRGNTGDGLRMAQAVGADLRHMWHFHGSYGFRHPDPAYVFGIRTKKLPDWTPGVQPPTAPLSWILVDRTGRRFMNEYEPYAHDTSARAFDRFDATTLQMPAVPATMLFDETRRKLYPVARSFINDPDIRCYDWSDDNLKEVDLGMLQRADTLDEVARALQVDPAVLHATIGRWNDLCATDAADPLGRPAGSRAPVVDPPFYFGHVWPVVSNTQGALAHDVEQRVLDPYGAPIAGLYVAGELGSIWGYVYLSGGNLAECFISGRIAAHAAAARAA